MKFISAITATAMALILSTMIGSVSAQQHCRLNLNIKCTVLDGKNGGKGTPCHKYRPCIKKNGKGGKCLCENKTNCERNVRYDFEYKNANKKTLRLDTGPVTEPEQCTAKINRQVISNNRRYFKDDVTKWNKKRWSITEWNLDVCDRIPGANLRVIGDLINPKTNKPDLNFKRCDEFFKVRNHKFQHLGFCDNDAAGGLVESAADEIDAEIVKEGASSSEPEPEPEPEAIISSNEEDGTITTPSTSINEVENSSEPEPETVSDTTVKKWGDNEALGKTATQSSTYGGAKFEAGTAVNGDKRTYAELGSHDNLSHTEKESNPWWQVDLGDIYYINRVVIHNREDSARLSGYRLEIFDDNASTAVFTYDDDTSINVNGPGDVITIHVPSETVGRTAKISIPGRSEYLNLREVEVFALTASEWKLLPA